MPRSRHFALFAIGLLWVLAARTGAGSAADGFTRVLHTDVPRHLLNAIFLLVLLPTGFTALNWVGFRNGSIRSTNALPVRPTVRQEWREGVALGWGLVLCAALPVALFGMLHPQFWWQPRAWGLLLLSLLTLLVGSLATELAFRGFLFTSLIKATGPVTATLLLSLVYALETASSLNTTPFSFLISFLLGVLFSMAYLRTHALWLGWGLRFGWLASMGVLLGLPLAGSSDMSSVVATDTSGPAWFSGGAYGLEGAVLTIFVLLGGMFVLYRLTRDYAWQYTHPPIVAGGYPMDVPPPAAHTAMEAKAPPPPLVQILGATPVNASTEPRISEHLSAVVAAEANLPSSDHGKVQSAREDQ